MTSALETETKSKVELLRVKKKLEADIVDLGMNLEHANAANEESQKNIKRINNNIREVQSKLEAENRAKTIAQDNLLNVQRKANANQNSL